MVSDLWFVVDVLWTMVHGFMINDLW